jgi:hypothetical protein
MARPVRCNNGGLMAFKPIGEVARWRKVYRVFQKTPIGRTVTFRTLAAELEMDAEADRGSIRAAARMAAQELLRKEDRAVESVPGEGYRIVTAGRQIALAANQVERAATNLDRGRELTSHIRLDELNAQERQIVHTMALGFSQVAAWARQIGRRVEDHEGRLSDIEDELRRIREDRGGKS